MAGISGELGQPCAAHILSLQLQKLEDWPPRPGLEPDDATAIENVRIWLEKELKGSPRASTCGIVIFNVE
jgi:hypothetical protein